MYTPVNPNVDVKKCGLRGSKLYRHKKVREKPRECHNHKPQPFLDPKRKRKPINPNKYKSSKRTKSTYVIVMKCAICFCLFLISSSFCVPGRLCFETVAFE